DRDGLTAEMPGTGRDEDEEEELVCAERQRRDDERACALTEHGRSRCAERPGAVPEVVAAGCDEEGDRRGAEVVQAGREERGVDGEVDRIARRADRAEADALAFAHPAGPALRP